MRLRDVKIGSVVSIPPWGTIGTLVGFNGSLNLALVGHGDDPKTKTKHFHVSMADELAQSDGMEMDRALASSFTRAAWFGSDFECDVASSPIVNPNQKCSQCEKPSPHSNPNKDDKFVCVWCEVEEDFIEELPHTD